MEKLVDALLASKKPNYADLENYGQKLCNKDKKSALGNLALGLGLMYKKKPNLKKAMDCLAIAKSAAEKMGGRLTAANRPESGAAFTLVLACSDK